MDGTAHGFYMSVAIGNDDTVFVAANTEDPYIRMGDDAFQRIFAGKEDAVLVRFSADLADIVGCTYLGGSEGENCSAWR